MGSCRRRATRPRQRLPKLRLLVQVTTNDEDRVPLLVRWPGVVKPGGESRALLSGEDLAPTFLAAAGVAAPSRMTGVNFLPLLEGRPFVSRKYVFTERGPHGSAPVTVNMKNSGYDLSRAVRTERYKFIYNCTPWIPYAPVDSAGGAGWQEMTTTWVSWGRLR